MTVEYNRINLFSDLAKMRAVPLNRVVTDLLNLVISPQEFSQLHGKAERERFQQMWTEQVPNVFACEYSPITITEHRPVFPLLDCCSGTKNNNFMYFFFSTKHT